jgi:hypothetical protein
VNTLYNWNEKLLIIYTGFERAFEQMLENCASFIWSLIASNIPALMKNYPLINTRYVKTMYSHFISFSIPPFFQFVFANFVFHNPHNLWYRLDNWHGSIKWLRVIDYYLYEVIDVPGFAWQRTVGLSLQYDCKVNGFPRCYSP